MKPAKVVHLSSVHSAFDTRIFHKECKSLARAGYQVVFVVPHDKDEVVDGVRIKAVPKPRKRLSRMTKTAWKVYREAVRQKANVYHFHDPELIPVGLILKARGKRVVYDMHEDTSKVLFSRDYLPSCLRPFLSRLAESAENTTAGFFSCLVAATPSIAERFTARNRYVVVLHNFPRLQELAPTTDGQWNLRAHSVAYVGDLDANRGIRELIAAMDLLPEGLNATLKLAGEFSLPSFGEELARLPGWRRVQMSGLVDREGVARTLGNVRAGLVPFLPEPNHIEAMPQKFFEYMSAGIPVIASDFPLWRKIIEGAGCGLLVDPSSPRAIADAIHFVLTRPQEAEAMGRRGREAVEKRYNWESEEKKLLEIYADLVNSSCAA